MGHIEQASIAPRYITVMPVHEKIEAVLRLERANFDEQTAMLFGIADRSIASTHLYRHVLVWCGSYCAWETRYERVTRRFSVTMNAGRLTRLDTVHYDDDSSWRVHSRRPRARRFRGETIDIAFVLSGQCCHYFHAMERYAVHPLADDWRHTMDGRLYDPATMCNAAGWDHGMPSSMCPLDGIQDHAALLLWRLVVELIDEARQCCTLDDTAFATPFEFWEHVNNTTHRSCSLHDGRFWVFGWSTGPIDVARLRAIPSFAALACEDRSNAERQRLEFTLPMIPSKFSGSDIAFRLVYVHRTQSSLRTLTIEHDDEHLRPFVIAKPRHDLAFYEMACVRYRSLLHCAENAVLDGRLRLRDDDDDDDHDHDDEDDGESDRGFCEGFDRSDDSSSSSSSDDDHTTDSTGDDDDESSSWRVRRPAFVDSTTVHSMLRRNLRRPLRLGLDSAVYDYWRRVAWTVVHDVNAWNAVLCSDRFKESSCCYVGSRVAPVGPVDAYSQVSWHGHTMNIQLNFQH